MKNLRGYKRAYFKLAIIAMYSTICKLSKIEINMLYHRLAYESTLPSRAPPKNFLNS